MIRVGINGMGRIGRNVLRIIENIYLKNQSIMVVAINESSSELDHLVYQIKNDTIHGLDKNNNYMIIDDELYINNHHVMRFKTRDINMLHWNKAKVDVVIEATGKFLTADDCIVHLKNGASKVIISAPPKDNTPMYLMGVNENNYQGENIISNGSCTTNCLAPFLKLLEDNYKIEHGLMSTIHSTTASQSILDSKNFKNWRLGRSASMNIIPSTTGAAKAVGKVIPSLEGKLTGMAYRVPTTNGSVVDLNIVMKSEPSIEEIKLLIEKNKSKFVAFAPEGCVSTDIIGSNVSSIVDIDLSIKINNMYKFVIWYDNEYGYSSRIVDLIFHIMKN